MPEPIGLRTPLSCSKRESVSPSLAGATPRHLRTCQDGSLSPSPPRQHPSLEVNDFQGSSRGSCAEASPREGDATWPFGQIGATSNRSRTAQASNQLILRPQNPILCATRCSRQPRVDANCSYLQTSTPIDRGRDRTGSLRDDPRGQCRGQRAHQAASVDRGTGLRTWFVPVPYIWALPGALPTILNVGVCPRSRAKSRSSQFASDFSQLEQMRRH